MLNYNLLKKINDGDADAIISLVMLKSYHKRRERTVGRIEKSHFELSVLEDIYAISGYPDHETKKNVSILLGMPQKAVQIWFQNRRRNKCASRHAGLHDHHFPSCCAVLRENVCPAKADAEDGRLFAQVYISPCDLLKIYFSRCA